LLLAGSDSKSSLSLDDEFEDLLKILDELSYQSEYIGDFIEV
jgi:hypothetical protein